MSKKKKATSAQDCVCANSLVKDVQSCNANSVNYSSCLSAILSHSDKAAFPCTMALLNCFQQNCEYNANHSASAACVKQVWGKNGEKCNQGSSCS